VNIAFSSREVGEPRQATIRPTGEQLREPPPQKWRHGLKGRPCDAMRLIKVICGDGLPVSLMLVGRHFDEPTIYRAALHLSG
jgi:hypothetical protein